MTNRKARRKLHSDAIYEEYEKIMEIVAEGDENQLNKLAQEVEGFPGGCDCLVKRHWITNAIDCGSIASIRWMLSRNVPLDFRDEEGRSPLHCAIDRDNEDKYQVLELILKHGAPTGLHGFNDWTPLHRAAAFNDVEACRILLHYGADPEARTRIDDYATPFEEAVILKKQEAADFLKEYTRGSSS